MTYVSYQGNLLFPDAGSRPMRVVVFCSGGGGNFSAVLALAAARPDLVEVIGIVCDRHAIRAIDIARQNHLFCHVEDFVQLRRQARLAGLEYAALAEDAHDRITDILLARQVEMGLSIDLIVLSYRRLIAGRLLSTFQDRIVNQHPGDLAFRGQSGNRELVGLHAVRDAWEAGHPATRTTTHLVNAEMDGGEILCRGPWVPFVRADSSDSVHEAWLEAHENRQKEASDWPSLTFALEGIATGQFAVNPTQRHEDGCRMILLNGVPLPYGGKDLFTNASSQQNSKDRCLL